MVFEWDEEKNAANIKKHGIGFEEAAAVFCDPLIVEQYDLCQYDIDSTDQYEERWLAFGFVTCWLAVSFTERDGIIRIISARKATQQEVEELYD